MMNIFHNAMKIRKYLRLCRNSLTLSPKPLEFTSSSNEADGRFFLQMQINNIAQVNYCRIANNLTLSCLPAEVLDTTSSTFQWALPFRDMLPHLFLVLQAIFYFDKFIGSAIAGS